MNESSLSFKYFDFDFSPFSDVIKNVFAIINQATQYSSNWHSKKISPAAGSDLHFSFMNSVLAFFYRFAFFIHKLDISEFTNCPGKNSLADGRQKINRGPPNGFEGDGNMTFNFPYPNL